MRRRPEDTTVVFPRGTAPARLLQRSRLAPAAHGRGWLRRDTRARAHAAPSDAQDHTARRRPGFAGGAAAGCAGAPLLAGAGSFRQGRAASRLVGRRSHGVKSWNVSSIRGEHAPHAFTVATSKAT